MAIRDVPKNGRKLAEGLPTSVGNDVLGPARDPDRVDAPSALLHFDRFVLDLQRGCVRRDDVDVALRPKTFDLLRYLAANSGRLVSKDELFAAIWPDVVVTDDSLVQCVAELRRALGDADQRLIRTVPRRGYRFEAETSPETTDTAPGLPARPPARWFAVRALLGVFLLLALAVAGGWWRHGNGDRVAAPPLSIVVLPFQPVGEEPDQAYLADAIAHDLSTDLARLPGLFVIAHATARRYRAADGDLRQTAHDLNVRYVLDGSVDRTGDEVRINAELVSAETGAALWAERFSAPRDRLARSRDEIVGRIATTLNFKLTRLESERGQRERPTDPAVADLTTRGWALVYAGKQPTNYRKARGFFQQAVERDPGAVNALAGIGWTSAIMVLDGWSTAPAADIAAGESAIDRALDIDRNHVIAQHVRGFLFRLQRRSAAALDSFRTVVALNPNFAPGHAQLGITLLELGRPEEVAPIVQQAMRLSPRDPSLGPWLAFIGMAELHRGNFDAAVPWLNRAIDTGTPVARHRAYLASALALAGQQPEAEAALNDFRERKPEATIESLRAGARSDAPAFIAQQESLFDGLRLAGLPD